jgi:hypothetical protein
MRRYQCFPVLNNARQCLKWGSCKGLGWLSKRPEHRIRSAKINGILTRGVFFFARKCAHIKCNRFVTKAVKAVDELDSIIPRLDRPPRAGFLCIRGSSKLPLFRFCKDSNCRGSLNGSKFPIRATLHRFLDYARTAHAETWFWIDVLDTYQSG